MVKRTVVHDMMQRFCTKTTMTVLIFNMARTEYHGGHTDSGHKTKVFLFTVSSTILKSFRPKRLTRIFCPKILAENFATKESQAHQPRMQETRPVVSRRAVGGEQGDSIGWDSSARRRG